MNNSNYSTILHDLLHVKDYFSNYKFTYKERKSKLDFLLNINNESMHDTTSLIASSKKQLVEVKNVYKETDEEIRELSMKAYEEERRLDESTKQLEKLVAEAEVLQEEYDRLREVHEKVLISDKLNEELCMIEDEINSQYSRMDANKRNIDTSMVGAKLNEERELKEQRNDLAAKQRRLTIINTENYIEDIFYWEKQYLEVLEKILGTMTVTVVEDRCTLKVSKSSNSAVLEVSIRGKKLFDCFLPRNITEKTAVKFEKIREYALKINDTRPLLVYFMLNC